MPHKTFEDETFPIKTVNLEVNSLTEADPYVDHAEIVPKSGNVDSIKYSANKEQAKEGELTDPVSGVKFEATTTEKVDQRVSDLPELLKKIKALADEDGRDVKLNTNIGRYRDEDGENTSFYITDQHLENATVVTEDEADEGEQGNEEEDETSDSSSDQDAESQDGSADSNESTEDEEDSSTESTEDEEELISIEEADPKREWLEDRTVEQVKEDLENIDEPGLLTLLEDEAERRTSAEAIDRRRRQVIDEEEAEDSEEENQDEEDDEEVIFGSED